MMRLPLKPSSLSLPRRRAPGMRAGFSAAPRRRAFASKPPPPPAPAPFPTVETCPSPTCGCAPMPPFPDGLEIDRAAPMNGVVAAYAEQVLVCTGRDDWASRIEDDEGGDNFAADMKRAFGRGGRYTDPFHNVSVLNASFPSSPSPAPGTGSAHESGATTSLYLLPSFKYIPSVPRGSEKGIDALAKGHLLPRKLHPHHDGLSPEEKARLTRDEAGYAGLLGAVEDVEDVVVLICGHGGRDARCGVLGPVLRDEFEKVLASTGHAVRTGARSAGRSSSPDDGDGRVGARVGLISHIGGHKLAGNAIIYVPPGLRMESGAVHPLAGHGIWYGRVEPRHVDGIVRETVLKGNVVKDLLRGGIDPDRRILRL
ncbi:hypothetical protein N3K66_006914 [Trichothecium roseum]|uniref:Uncharacterized protein n=1 Tax=Trichothecium roseum TaxID=47278 RepID=A0ACC0UX53_9HYPO|nr:hypothetical protein N3K66_006914 [Trichothecium roseum]